MCKCEIDGIYYLLDVTTKKAIVTYSNPSNDGLDPYANSSSYTGSIIIPNTITYDGTIYTVTSIGNNAFEYCNNLTSITIPNSVTEIGDYAFYGCRGLTSVISNITNVFNIDLSVFGGCENSILYVPNGLVGTYKSRVGWNIFKSIVDMDSHTIPLQISCNSKGSITFNETIVFTNKIGSVDILDEADNTIVFTPKVNCKLEQVCLNGFDITPTVEDNTLKAVIPANSQMVVTFAKESGDMNNDGNIDISDVVSLVNMILGQ